MRIVDEKILLGIIIGGGSFLFFLILFLVNRFRRQRELKKQRQLRNASRAPLSSMRSQRSDRRNARRHVVSRGLQLDQLSDSAKQAYQQRQQRRVSQYSDLQLVMDELFIPERDALETEDEEEESDEEGLSTGAKVALGVGALAAGVALFGAEDDDPYENQTDYSRIYEATSGRGEIEHDRIDSVENRPTIMRHDNPYTDYDWESDKDLSEDEQLVLEEYIEDEVGTSPEKGERDFNIDVEDKEVYVQTDTVYGEGRFYDFAAEHESESDGYTYAYTKGHKDGMDNEVIYRPSIETDREKTIFKKILKQKADTVGNPSPSGPSSTPEPAEATGSEPSNEEFKGENRNLAIGLTAAGVGLVALLGADRIKKLFDRFNL